MSRIETYTTILVKRDSIERIIIISFVTWAFKTTMSSDKFASRFSYPMITLPIPGLTLSLPHIPLSSPPHLVSLGLPYVTFSGAFSNTVLSKRVTCPFKSSFDDIFLGHLTFDTLPGVPYFYVLSIH